MTTQTAFTPAQLLLSPDAIVCPSPEDLGSWMEWSDEDACDLIPVLIPGDRYYFLCSLLSGGYRFASAQEVEQYYANL